MIKKAWLFFPLIIILTSCLSIGSGVNKSQADQPPHEQQSRSVIAHQPEITLQEQNNSGLWVSGPINGKFIIIGVSGRLSRPNDEIEAAKLDAAAKAAMYYGIQGSVEYSNTSGSGGFFDYSADSRLVLNYDTNYANYISNLSFDPEKDILRGDNATYVRFSYSAITSNINYSPVKSNDRPSWVNNRNMPEFDGYVTVVGFAGRRSRLRDTISASCESAAARLIENASTSVINQEQSSTRHGATTASSTYTRSEGRLNNFQILAFWIDPSSGAVSTLATARVSK